MGVENKCRSTTKQEARPGQLSLTNGVCVGLWRGMLSGQHHLCSRRIRPVALREAAKNYCKAQHHHLATGRCRRGKCTSSWPTCAHQNHLRLFSSLLTVSLSKGTYRITIQSFKGQISMLKFVFNVCHHLGLQPYLLPKLKSRHNHRVCFTGAVGNFQGYFCCWPQSCFEVKERLADQENNLDLENNFHQFIALV